MQLAGRGAPMTAALRAWPRSPAVASTARFAGRRAALAGGGRGPGAVDGPAQRDVVVAALRTAGGVGAGRAVGGREARGLDVERGDDLRVHAALAWLGLGDRAGNVIPDGADGIGV